MSPEQMELARRLVAHPRWRWVDGMAVSYRRPDGTMSPRGRWPVPLMHNQENVPELSDYATAAILLRMCAEIETDLHANRHTPRRVVADGTVLEDGLRRWACHVDDGYSWVEREDLGTVAATALLAAWSGPGSS